MEERLCNPAPEDDFRHQQMALIRDLIVAEFESHAAQWALTHSQKIFFLDFVQHKISQPGVRGYFVRAIYCWIKKQLALEGVKPKRDFDKAVLESKLSLVAEWVMSVQYRENHILDGKFGLCKNGRLDKGQTEKALLSSHFLKDKLYDYVEENVFGEHPSAAQRLKSVLRQMFQLVEEGQHHESEYGHYDHYKSNVKKVPVLSGLAEAHIEQSDIDWFWQTIKTGDLAPQKEFFVRQYLRRINLAGAAMFVLWAKWMMDELGYTGRERQSLLRFAARYGMLAQLVNDVGDFVPCVFQKEGAAKHPEDAMSDLRNDVVTLPMLFFFQENPKTTLKDLQELYQLNEMAVFDKIRPVVWHQVLPVVWKMADEIKTLLPCENPYSACLADMTNLAYSKKLFRYFEEKKYRAQIKKHLENALCYVI